MNRNLLQKKRGNSAGMAKAKMLIILGVLVVLVCGSMFAILKVPALRKFKHLFYRAPNFGNTLATNPVAVKTQGSFLIGGTASTTIPSSLIPLKNTSVQFWQNASGAGMIYILKQALPKSAEDYVANPPAGFNVSSKDISADQASINLAGQTAGLNAVVQMSSLLGTLTQVRVSVQKTQ